ncbi:flavin-containing monooxygenase [Ornithinimicrobium sp. Y1694]|uniref:flavin-containing monooxygenase n=1 Tax=Ornithinimicrobium sp. Y1694 TaxID=3418590 RepID=UPI003CFBC0EB
MAYLVRQRDRAPAVTAPLPVNQSLPRACVIGAGSSGLAATKALAEAGVPVDCVERGPVVGGNWVLNNPNGVSACYDTLEINTSCRRMAFSDFPMPADYPAYARHDQVAAYFEAYVEHFGFRDRITFGTEVTDVRPVDGGWEVDTRGPEGQRTRRYAAVLVANGHHWDAHWPDPPYPGEFAGEQLHAHDYRGADQLAGRDVVVVGAGNSAMDIATEAARVARTATISQRRGQWVLPKFALGRPSDEVAFPGWAPWLLTRAKLRLGARRVGSLRRFGLPHPEHPPDTSHPVQSETIRSVLASGALTPRPGIARLAGDRVEFVDGTSAAADLIVWATGYRVSFPFLDEALVSAPDNDLPLWKRVVHPDLPGLFFIGLPQPVGAVMPVAEAQGRWIAQWLTGDYLPPAREVVRRELLADDERNKKRFYGGPRHTMQVDFDHYLWDLGRERQRGRRRARQWSRVKAR